MLDRKRIVLRKRGSSEENGGKTGRWYNIYCTWKVYSLYQESVSSFELILKAPMAKKDVCFSRLLK